jgi:hypothetical protein
MAKVEWYSEENKSFVCEGKTRRGGKEDVEIIINGPKFEFAAGDGVNYVQITVNDAKEMVKFLQTCIAEMEEQEVVDGI